MTVRTSIARLADEAPPECPDCGAPESATRVLDFYCQHVRCPMMPRRLTDKQRAIGRRMHREFEWGSP
jgi:hypothetical protein